MWRTRLQHSEPLTPMTERESVAAWMIAQGFSTGHGDTLADLLAELAGQIEALRGWLRPVPRTLADARAHLLHVIHDAHPIDDWGHIEPALDALIACVQSPGWQPINDSHKRGGPMLVALMQDGHVWRVSDAVHNGLGWYTRSGGIACHWATHAMPLPAPPAAPTNTP